jgi:tetratricopeptide (TPR) repeat protein
MCIAVGVFVWLASESRRAEGLGRTANSHPLAKENIPAERLQLLAHFEPPPYTPAPADSPRFQLAMGYYAKGNYAKAIPELRPLTESGNDAIAARFYLGICFLLTKDRASGMQQLRAIIDAPKSVYSEPANFYLAKALLGAGDTQAADEQLEKVIAMHGDNERDAHILLGQIR